ncbi:MAG TPA: hypothetical protein VI564_06440 [Candidatus Nanoarchaeia archaeon]|nr:hypothetical protein [Candidatus Nanoarchaeia archaeon]
MKKKSKKNRAIASEYLQDMGSALLDSVAKTTTKIVRESRTYRNVNRLIRGYIVIAVFGIVSILLILEGASIFISSLYPKIMPGIIHILAGALILIILVIIKKFYVQKEWN